MDRSPSKTSRPETMTCPRTVAPSSTLSTANEEDWYLEPPDLASFASVSIRITAGAKEARRQDLDIIDVTSAGNFAADSLYCASGHCRVVSIHASMRATAVSCSWLICEAMFTISWRIVSIFAAWCPVNRVS